MKITEILVFFRQINFLAISLSSNAVAFTKFLPKNRESKVLKFPHCISPAVREVVLGLGREQQRLEENTTIYIRRLTFGLVKCYIVILIWNT